MVCSIIVKVDGDATPINLDQNMTFDRVDHGFSVAVLSVAGFGVDFHSLIHLPYTSLEVIMELARIRSKPFTLLFAFAYAVHSFVGTFPS